MLGSFALLSFKYKLLEHLFCIYIKLHEILIKEFIAL